MPESPTYRASNISITAQPLDFISQSHHPTPAAPGTSMSPAMKQKSIALAEPQPWEQPTQQLATVFTNPFTECTNTFGSYLSLQFSRPSDGKINGYVKFNWVRPTHESNITELVDDEIPTAGLASPVSSQSPNCILSPLSDHLHKSDSASSIVKITISPTPPVAQRRVRHPTFTKSPYSARPKLSYFSKQNHMFEANAPQLVPPHFGRESILDTMGRKLWQFCTARPRVF